MQNQETVLVTGGCGFVGTNLCRHLSASNHVRVLDELKRASPTGWHRDAIDLYQADILDSASLSPAFDDVSKVVHLAAYGSVVESVNDPARNFEVNAMGTLNVLQAAVRAGARKLVFASTGGALIGDATPPVNEQSLPRPISPYGASKLCGEAYCHAFAKSYDLETVCLRFGNVYGAHSAHKKGAVTTFIKALMNDDPLVIYGDGSASRDYIHVDDLSRGILAALDATGIGGETFHLAAGRETTIVELAKILADVAGKPDHPIEFRSARRGEVARNFADYAKARQVLGFEPSHSLEDGLAETWDWFMNQDDAALAIEATDS